MRGVSWSWIIEVMLIAEGQQTTVYINSFGSTADTNTAWHDNLTREAGLSDTRVLQHGSKIIIIIIIIIQ